MRVFIASLDNPSCKYSFVYKDFEVTSPEQVVGFVGERIYAELYDIKESDDPVLLDSVQQVLKLYPNPLREAIKDLLSRTKDGR
jgi:hypothetical protein